MKYTKIGIIIFIIFSVIMIFLASLPLPLDGMYRDYHGVDDDYYWYYIRMGISTHSRKIEFIYLSRSEKTKPICGYNGGNFIEHLIEYFIGDAQMIYPVQNMRIPHPKYNYFLTDNETDAPVLLGAYKLKMPTLKTWNAFIKSSPSSYSLDSMMRFAASKNDTVVILDSYFLSDIEMSTALELKEKELRKLREWAEK